MGPAFAALSTLYLILILIISHYFQFKIESGNNILLEIAGIFLLAIGIVFYIISVVKVMKAYNSDKLITSNIYKFCRHPLYASWVVFIVPGIVLLCNNWIGFTMPIFMYIILRILVKKEENYLENKFGKDYTNYKNKIPCILPYGILKK